MWMVNIILVLIFTGKIRIWNVLNGTEIYVHDSNVSKESPIVELFYIESSQSLLEIRADQTITSYKLDHNFSTQKQVHELTYFKIFIFLVCQ